MSGYSRWEDAMVAQTQLLHHTMSPTGREFLAHMEASMQAQHAPKDRKPSGFFQPFQRLTLESADPVYVSMDVTDVIDYARESFEPEPVRVNDPFTQFGFCLFPRPFMLDDASVNDTDVVPIRAMAWFPIISEDDPEVGAFWISYYTDAYDDVAAGRFTPKVAADLASKGGQLSLAHMFQWEFGTTPTDDAKERFTERRCRECDWIVLGPHRETCSLRKHSEVVEDDQATDRVTDDAYHRAVQQSALVQTVWRIGQQVFRGKERAPRGIWRDANRKGIQHKDVTVIKLRRRTEGKEYEPTGRQLTVRHLVRGYWRRQHYKDGVRQVWVSPHVRGGDDLPFKLTERAFDFSR